MLRCQLLHDSSLCPGVRKPAAGIWSLTGIHARSRERLSYKAICEYGVIRSESAKIYSQQRWGESVDCTSLAGLDESSGR